MEWQAIATVTGIVVCLLGLLTLTINVASRNSKTQATAEEAHRMAREGLESIALVRIEFSVYRERVAEQYASRAIIREVEDRVTDAIVKLGDRFDKIIVNRMGQGRQS